MNVLCIDTSTGLGTVALARDGQLVASAQWESSKGHAEVLLSSIDRVLAKGEVDREKVERVGVCIGPGGFTAVRVGLATAKGIVLGLGAEIAGVLSLRVVARSCDGSPGAVRLCALNAYRGDVYAAAYQVREDGTVEEICAPLHGPPGDVVATFAPALEGLDVRVCGGAAGAAGLIEEAAQDHGWSSAGDIRPSPTALVDEVLDRFASNGPDELVSLEPLYLRPSDAQLPSTPLQRL